MTEIVTTKPKETIHVSKAKLQDGIIIASSQSAESNYYHPHGIIVKTEAGYNVINSEGKFQFDNRSSIEDLITHYSRSGWRFFQFKQGNYNF